MILIVFDPSGFIGVSSLSSGKAQSADGGGRYVFVLFLCLYVHSQGGNTIISDWMPCAVATSPWWHVILSSASQCVFAIMPSLITVHEGRISGTLK